MKTGSTGILTDGSGTSDYGNNADCGWLIAPTGATQIALRFKDFNTQKGVDVVRVTQCATLDCANGQELAALSGTYSTPQLVVSSTSFMKVAFTSDGSITRSGFSALWTSVGLLCVHTYCHVCVLHVGFVRFGCICRQLDVGVVLVQLYI